jgi:hypothetical protein
MSEHSKIFNEVLLRAKHCLDSIDIPFHLHSGTALGAHREHDFIEHDDDIDLAVFYSDVNRPSQVNKIIEVMTDAGFELDDKLGTLKRGFELKFWDAETEIPLDIFWVYEAMYRGKKYYILSSYYDKCDNFKHKACVWAYRPYKTVKMDFLGHKYNVLPTKTLVDAYGKDWKIPKKFSYSEGLESGYKSMIQDFYDPIPIDTKIAFCFLVYDQVKHPKQWQQFFKEDSYPIKSYSIYSHIKKITEFTQPWLIDNKIKTINTEWCGESLVWAWINMLKEALKDKKNKYFTILSGECIPLFGFWDTYNKIVSSSKSRVNIDPNAESTADTGLVYADQWVILNRKHAKLLIKLKETVKGQKYANSLKKIIGGYCPDELYPINWFIYNYGKPYTSSFKKEFKLTPSTFTYWTGKKPHPIKYNSPKMKADKPKICRSGAVFARKFNNKAAKELSGNCPSKRKTSRPKKISRRK